MKNVITSSYRRIRRPIVLATIIALNVLLLVSYYLIASNSDASEYVYSDHIKLDTVSAAPDAAELYARVANEMPALPIEQLLNFPKLGFALNASCAPYPDLYDIKYYNNYWQTFELPDATIQLFGAYYDKRKAVPEAPLLRLLTMINGSEYTSNITYCQIWFHGQTKPAIVPATDFSMIWYKEWGKSAKHVYPHLIACKIPEMSKQYIPQTVSLVRDPCERATNNLKVYYEPPAEGEPQQFGFAICVKAIDFKYVDMSARLIEWIEVQRQLGARSITIHNYQLHPNVTRVLEYYESTGFVDFRPFAFARGEPNIGEFAHIAGDIDNHNRILHEVIPYNDCFYRNMYKYEFISAQDIDEVIMPLGNLTDWHKLFDVVRGWPSENCKIRQYSSYCFRNVYFPRYPEKPRIFEDLPEYFYMLQHVERVRKHLDPNLATKCFHSTAYCTKLHNHFPMGFVDSCYPLSVNATTAQMEHFREPDIKETLNDPVFDDNMWRFKNEIVNRSMSVLDKLGFLEKVSTDQKI